MYSALLTLVLLLGDVLKPTSSVQSSHKHPHLRSPLSATSLSDLQEQFSSSSSSLPYLAVGGGLAATAIAKAVSYVQMQFITAGMVGGIPAKSIVVELDALDGSKL